MMLITTDLIRKHLPYAWGLYERLRSKLALSDPAIENLPTYMDEQERDQIIMAFACDATRTMLDQEFGFTVKLLPNDRVVAFLLDIEHKIDSDLSVEELRARYPNGFDLALDLPDLARCDRRVRLSGLPKDRGIREAYNLLAVDPYRQLLCAQRKAA